MKIKSDKRLNKRLAKEVQDIRSVLLDDVEESVDLPKRFKSKPSRTSPSMIITDTKTGRSVSVGLFGYSEVILTLKKLFG